MNVSFRQFAVLPKLQERGSVNIKNKMEKNGN